MINVRVDLQRHEDCLVARIEGELDFANAPGVAGEISDAITNDVIGLAVDLSVVRFIDSAGIRMLFRLFSQATVARRSGALVLGGTSTVRTLVQMARLDSVVKVFPDVEGAVGYLNNGDLDREPGSTGY